MQWVAYLPGNGCQLVPRWGVPSGAPWLCSKAGWSGEEEGTPPRSYKEWRLSRGKWKGKTRCSTSVDQTNSLRSAGCIAILGWRWWRKLQNKQKSGLLCNQDYSAMLLKFVPRKFVPLQFWDMKISVVFPKQNWCINTLQHCYNVLVALCMPS